MKKSAFCLGLFSGPNFSYNLIGIEYSKKKKYLFTSVGVIYLIVTIIELTLYPSDISNVIRKYFGIPILFGVFAYFLIFSAMHLGKLGSKTLNISLKVSFLIAIIVFPVSLFQHFTQLPFLPNYIEIPISFLILNILSIIFSFKYFNQPAYYEKNKLSEHFKKSFNITNRENDIISLTIKGLSNNEIGDKLFISPRTVESHLYKIFQKCGINNRTQLINLIISNKA